MAGGEALSRQRRSARQSRSGNTSRWSGATIARLRWWGGHGGVGSLPLKLTTSWTKRLLKRDLRKP